jgi:hypothetical protein
MTPLHQSAYNGFIDQVPYLILSKNKEICLERTTIRDYEESLNISKTAYIKETQEKLKNSQT